MNGQTTTIPTETEEALAAVERHIEVERGTILLIETELESHERALARLMDSRAALKGVRKVEKKQERRARVSGAVKTAAQRAGRGNMDRARDVLEHNGPTTKAGVTKLLGINDGTVHYALLALEENGEVRKTGERERGSDVYEYVSKRSRRAVTRPGDRR